MESGAKGCEVYVKLILVNSIVVQKFEVLMRRIIL